MDGLEIADMAARFGVTERALRLYEDVGLLQPARRQCRRVYSVGEVERMKLILLAKRMGLTLAEIGAAIRARTEHGREPRDIVELLDPHVLATHIEALKRQRDEVDAAIEELREAHLRSGSVDGGPACVPAVDG